MLKRFRFQMPTMLHDADSGTPPGVGESSPAPAAGTKTYTEEYVAALRGEAAGYRTQLRAAEKILGVIKTHHGLKESDQVDDWAALLAAAKASGEKAVADALTQGKALIMNAEVRAQVATLGIVDADAAIALADLSKAQVADDGKVTGVKEALEALLVAKPYLKAGTPPGPGSGSNPPGGTDTKNPFDKESFSLTEQGELFKKDPAKYERLKAAAKG